MNAPWSALYVETPSHHRLSKEAKEQVSRTLQLAEKLGATTATVFGLNVANTAIDYARRHNVTRIIIGKTLRPRWQEFVFGSVVDQLIHNSGTIDVYVISSEEKIPQKTGSHGAPLSRAPSRRTTWRVLFSLSSITIIGWLIHSFISPDKSRHAVHAWRCGHRMEEGLGPAIFTAVIGVLAFDFFFIPPYLTFRVSDTEYLITFAGMIIVGRSSQPAGCTVHANMPMQPRYARKRPEPCTHSRRTLRLPLIPVRSLPRSQNISAEIFPVGQHLPCTGRERAGGIRQASGGLRLDADDIAVATWAFQHGAVAGYDTDTLHGSRLRYIPLQSSREVLGIMGVKPAEPDGVITHEQDRILTAFANQTALALERVNLVRGSQNK